VVLLGMVGLVKAEQVYVCHLHHTPTAVRELTTGWQQMTCSVSWVDIIGGDRLSDCPPSDVNLLTSARDRAESKQDCGSPDPRAVGVQIM